MRKGFTAKVADRRHDGVGGLDHWVIDAKGAGTLLNGVQRTLEVGVWCLGTEQTQYLSSGLRVRGFWVT